LIRAAPFNFDSINVIKEKISNYIILFKFSTCVDQSIPIMLMNEENKEVQNVFMNDSILIRDVREKDLTLRQLIFRSNPYQIQCEIKTMLCSKTKIKNEKENYIPIKTLEKFTKKNLVQCFDDSFIAMFYIQALLTGIFFIDLYNFPQEKVKILVLGAGIGTINYYFDKILNSNVLIDAVELDKNVAEMGMEYFGLNNYKKEKNPDIKWHFKDAKEFIKEKNVSDYYDLIVMDINNTNSIEGISPPPVFFEQDVIDKIFTMLKPNGIYIIDLLARSYQGYKKVFNIIDSKFPHILYVDNNEDLNKIHFCFKNKRTKTENLQLYADGLKKLSNPEVGNIKDIESSANIFITKFVEASNQKEILDAYTS
jgi:SAM-dependent methyltransferase